MESSATERAEQVEQLAALFEIGSTILEALDVDRVLRLVCQRAQEILGTDGAAVGDWDEESGTITLSVCSGVLKEVSGRSFPVEGSLMWAAIEQQAVIIENDLQHSPAGRVARSLSILSDRAITAPLVVRGRVFGTLACVKSAYSPPFDDADARLLSAFANLAALATDNARLYEDEQRDSLQLGRLHAHGRALIQRLRTLHDAGVAVSADLNLEDLLTRIVEEARRLTGAQQGALGVLDPAGAGLRSFITSGIPEALAKRMGAPPSGKGLLGAVIRERSTIRVSSAEDDSRSVGVPDHHPLVSSFLGTPIKIGDRVYGNLYLTNKEDGRGFSEEDALIVEMLADQAAVAIQNADLFSQRDTLIRELESANRVRNRLQAYVHHDIRNALHGILLWAERMSQTGKEKEDLESGELDEIARKIRRGSDHALRLVGDVLDLTRLEEGKLQTWPRRIVGVDLVGAARDVVAPDADRRGIAIRSDDVPPTLELVSDPDRVLQILVNLLSNAVKFSPPGTTVTVRSEVVSGGPDGMEGEWVRLSVGDEGPGIAPEDQERIFEGFEQLNPETRKRGMGIGLTLSKLLARYLGGELSVESDVGSGSTFTLWLPVGFEVEGRGGWIG
jgi:signal transduction histidine kinase